MGSSVLQVFVLSVLGTASLPVRITDTLITAKAESKLQGQGSGGGEGRHRATGAHLFYNKQVYNSPVKDHVLLSSLRLENINTVFHEGEEDGRCSNLFACFTKCLRLPTRLFCVDHSSEGVSTCLPKSL